MALAGVFVLTMLFPCVPVPAAVPDIPAAAPPDTPPAAVPAIGENIPPRD
eukprot:CAMPEP_0180163468 /NCGR_PEP_ID=MMETSP0986-20121125/29817_1 /TAXON_ID=697907 /ORGANISM="non described non described, Strain CCMP2293" /LENGTH=49 /DNA_ID= /DNA_START= /DNA_END= /DNA_ORIENTATION=